MDRADVLMHPVRMRMVSLISRKPQTVQQLAKDLPDVASPTLYHHLNLLVKAGILEVVKAEQKRGAYEKTYALVQGNGVIGQGDLSSATHEDLMRLFQVFVGGLMGDYARYLQQKKDNNYGDMGLRQLPLYMSDEEFQRFISEFSAFMRPWLKLQPDPERQQRLFNIILMTMHPSDENDSE